MSAKGVGQSVIWIKLSCIWAVSPGSVDDGVKGILKACENHAGLTLCLPCK